MDLSGMDFVSENPAKDFDGVIDSEQEQGEIITLQDTYELEEDYGKAIEHNSQVVELDNLLTTLESRCTINRNDRIALESAFGDYIALPIVNSYTMDDSKVNYNITMEGLKDAIVRKLKDFKNAVIKFINGVINFFKRVWNSIFNRKDSDFHKDPVSAMSDLKEKYEETKEFVDELKKQGYDKIEPEDLHSSTSTTTTTTGTSTIITSSYSKTVINRGDKRRNSTANDDVIYQGYNNDKSDDKNELSRNKIKKIHRILELSLYPRYVKLASLERSKKELVTLDTLLYEMYQQRVGSVMTELMVSIYDEDQKLTELAMACRSTVNSFDELMDTTEDTMNNIDATMEFDKLEQYITKDNQLGRYLFEKASNYTNTRNGNEPISTVVQTASNMVSSASRSQMKFMPSKLEYDSFFNFEYIENFLTKVNLSKEDMQRVIDRQTNFNPDVPDNASESFRESLKNVMEDFKIFSSCASIILTIYNQSYNFYKNVQNILFDREKVIQTVARHFEIVLK